MMKKCKPCFQVTPYSNCKAASLLFLRLVVGIAFVYHGWGKIQNPFGWMGPDAAIPGIFQALAALSEFGGGIALALGLVMPLATLGIALTMFVATCMHIFVFGDPFVATGGGGAYEPALGYFAVALMFMAMGPGKYSADAKIFGTK